VFDVSVLHAFNMARIQAEHKGACASSLSVTGDLALNCSE